MIIFRKSVRQKNYNHEELRDFTSKRADENKNKILQNYSYV